MNIESINNKYFTIMSLEQTISKEIMAAMQAKDVSEAKTASAGIDELADADVVKIISKLAKQGADSAAIYTQQNRADLAEEEMAQVRVMQEFLPRPLTAEELAEAVKTIIADLGATSMKDMGRVMGEASKRLAGKADGKDISAKVRELLA